MECYKLFSRNRGLAFRTSCSLVIGVDREGSFMPAVI
jgi:hypothetical protein